jgi:hypothetical protein
VSAGPPDLAAVVIGRDGHAVSDLVADLSARGVRAAAFVGDPASEQDALVEMLAELFPMPDD